MYLSGVVVVFIPSLPRILVDGGKVRGRESCVAHSNADAGRRQCERH